MIEKSIVIAMSDDDTGPYGYCDVERSLLCETAAVLLHQPNSTLPDWRQNSTYWPSLTGLGSSMHILCSN